MRAITSPPFSILRDGSIAGKRKAWFDSKFGGSVALPL